MKIYLELDETEYDAFKEYCKNYKELGPLAVRNRDLEDRIEQLQKLIRKECPGKRLVCWNGKEYRLEDE